MAHYHTVIGYAWQADMHCVACTKEAVDNSVLKIDNDHPHAKPLVGERDENDLLYNLVDTEGNIISPLFLGEGNNINEHCGDCGAALFPH